MNISFQQETELGERLSDSSICNQNLALLNVEVSEASEDISLR